MMSESKFIEQSRNSCAQHGALATFGAVEKSAPVLHSTAGCGAAYQHGVSLFGGAQTYASSQGAPVSSTNIVEKHVVFGGGSRLREQIKNTVRVVDADLYSLVTSCATEMVGDDIAAMAKEGVDQGFPIVYASTPGFSGAFHRGYQQALKALIEQTPSVLDVKTEKQPGVVNILGVIPQQDVFWQGHLLQLTRLLREIGLVANPLFGIGQGVEAWRKAPAASLNISFSIWGNAGAALLEQKYDAPWIDAQGLPIGSQGVTELVRRIGEKIQLGDAQVSAYLEREDRLFQANLERIAPIYYTKGFQREFAIIGELSFVGSAATFITKTLGLIPSLVVVTDPLSDEDRDLYSAPLSALVSEFDGELIFSDDFGEIDAKLKERRPQLVIGSSYEKSAATELGAPFLSAAFPVSDRLLLNRGYAGYEGAVTLLEDIGAAILSDG